MTPGSFSQFLRRVTNRSFTKHLQQYRLSRAALILGSKRRMVDIAFATGFGSLAQFNKVFRETYGTSPLRFRKSR